MFHGFEGWRSMPGSAVHVTPSAGAHGALLCSWLTFCTLGCFGLLWSARVDGVCHVFCRWLRRAALDFLAVLDCFGLLCDALGYFGLLLVYWREVRSSVGI